MRETNHSVYYTTAQVKDMVELSDQNVRKYVRLLEDRKYEVAKDEHNRRLFSHEDVSVLQEFIRLAKQPGYTMETAADEIIEQVPHIVSEKGQNMPINVTNNDINRMLGNVMEKLDTMQQENRALKDNVHHLVERLDSYSRYNPQVSLDYNADDEKVELGDQALSSRSDEVTNESDDIMGDESQSITADSDDTDSFNSEDSSGNTENDHTAKSNIDMSAYEYSQKTDEEKPQENVSTENEKEYSKQEEKSVLKRFFSIFK
ncbi:helix-turn-helix domain-containing protein [Salinicoccus albus]|uniref:helix-turn-helix domain-containing protein n=1 Tax=Salinicoccus albus TaxID=418756 RepID=UPI00036CD533|nr:helix-turn-helix domain-containing protein [Salinicoccus albus]